MNRKSKWVIGWCCTEWDGVGFEFFQGTEDEAIQFLLQFIKDERTDHEEDAFEWGTESADELSRCSFTDQVMDGTEHYGVNCYWDFHTDFTLKCLDDVRFKGVTNHE